jgi:hypothetical protein
MAHGTARLTLDLDVVGSRAGANLERFATSLDRSRRTSAARRPDFRSASTLRAQSSIA